MPNYLDYLQQSLTTADRAPFATIPVRSPLIVQPTTLPGLSGFNTVAPAAPTPAPVVPKSNNNGQLGTSRQALTAPPAGKPASSSAPGHTVSAENNVPSYDEFVNSSRAYLQNKIDAAQAAVSADPSDANKRALLFAKNNLSAFEQDQKKPNINPTAARQGGQAGFSFGGGISGGEQGPRKYSIDYDASGNPIYLRTIFMNGTAYTTPIDRFTYETENYTQLDGRAGTTVSPDQRPKAVAPQRDTSLTIPAEFQNLSDDAIAQLPTGPEYLRLRDAQAALDATGHAVSEFYGPWTRGELDAQTVSQMPGGEEFLGVLSAKALYDQSLTRRANPAADNGDSTPETTDEGAAAPQVNTQAIDALTGDLSNIQGNILGIHADDGTNSLAQQQAAKDADLAQRHALGLAMGGSPRARSALAQQAIGEQAFIGSELSQQQANLRAQQEENTRRLKAEAAQAAADLGLNAGALDIDVNDLNMKSVSNYLSQMFADYRMNVQLDEDQAQRVTNFIRDMALVEEKYDELDQASKNAFFDRELKKYNIKANVALALKQADADRTQKWVDRGTQIAQTLALVAVASDRSAKTDIQGNPEGELENLLGSLKSYSFDYKDPQRHGAGRNLGVMAQDLQKTDIGSSMVSKAADGTLTVDAGKAGLAALSGLALVYEKLKKIEESL